MHSIRSMAKFDLIQKLKSGRERKRFGQVLMRIKNEEDLYNISYLLIKEFIDMWNIKYTTNQWKSDAMKIILSYNLEKKHISLFLTYRPEGIFATYYKCLMKWTFAKNAEEEEGTHQEKIKVTRTKGGNMVLEVLSWPYTPLQQLT